MNQHNILISIHLGSDNQLWIKQLDVDRLMIKNTGIILHLSKNDIRCFCHKITLILNAGLESTQLSIIGLIPSQVKNLGFVTQLAPIIEEVPQFTVEDIILGVGKNDQAEHKAKKRMKWILKTWIPGKNL
jgi:hypothetical protein